MNAFEADFHAYIRQIETELNRRLPAANCAQKRVIDAMAYSVLGGGKRVRATAVLAFYRMFAQTDNIAPALPFAAAVEMVHAYSLVHDDLPCMDDDDMRRGKPSCHIAFDEATAVLAGDGLLTLAFETMLAGDVLDAVGAEKAAGAAAELAGAIGAGGMVGGQMMDLQNEGQTIPEALLRETDEKKTGALFRASAGIGAILAGAGARERASAYAWADAVGLAFQIMDDLLDIKADPALLGKPIGSDIRQNKTTYLRLYGQERCEQLVLQLSEAACKQLEMPGYDSLFLQQLTQMLVNRTH